LLPNSVAQRGIAWHSKGDVSEKPRIIWDISIQNKTGKDDHERITKPLLYR